MRRELYENQGVAKNLDWDHLSDKWVQADKGGNQLTNKNNELGMGGDLIELDDKYSTYKIIPKEYSGKINTKLKGTFYVNPLGKVYYEHDKSLGKAIEKESLACVAPSTLGYEFKIISDLGTITGWNGNATHLVIPAAFKMSDGDKEWCEPVRVIGTGAFQNGTFKRVTIPQSVEKIQDEAFQGGELIEIEIPHSVKVIGNNAFTDNPATSSGGTDGLRIIVKGSSDGRSISDSAFGGSDYTYSPVTDKDLGVITKTKNNGGKTVSIVGKTATSDNSSSSSRDYSNTVINIPKELEINGEILPVTEIEKGAFQGSGLIDVIMPEGLLYIHDYAFAGNQLVRAVIPNSVIEVGSYAFAYNEIASKPTIDPINILESKFSGDFGYVDTEGNINQSVSTIGLKAHVFIISSMGNHVIEDVGFNSEEIVNKVDKSILIAELAKVKALNKDDYTSGWSEVQSVIQQAEIILNDEKSTQVNIDEILSDLKNAINGLVAKPEIPGPQPSKPVEGATDGTYTFHGEVSTANFITGNELASKIRLTAGTAYNNTEPWLKFTRKAEAGKITTMFVAKKPLRYNLSWDQINAKGAVFGSTTVEINGQTYMVRLMSNNEWDKMMVPLVVTWKKYTDADLLIHYYVNGSYSWVQDARSSYRVVRGFYGVSHSGEDLSNYVNPFRGWRPVLELVPAS